MEQTSYQKGLFAEKIAGIYLRLLGYKIVGQRFKTPFGEIDIIAYKNKTLVFVEVKARQSIELAKESITARNQHRVLKAAELYLQKNPQYNECGFRFDAMALAPWKFPHYIKNAWGQ